MRCRVRAHRSARLAAGATTRAVGRDGPDGCTFWYATEYYPAIASFAGATWLASLNFPNCLWEKRFPDS